MTGCELYREGVSPSSMQDGTLPEHDGGGAGFGWALGSGDSDGTRSGQPSGRAADSAAETRPTVRPVSPPAPSQQPSLADGLVPDGRLMTAVTASAMRPSTADLPSTQHMHDSDAQPLHLSTVYGKPPASAPPSQLLYSNYGARSPKRRHPNGLPLRQPAGALPGMPYVSDLTSRYPVRQAPPTRPEISLDHGQLYVGGTLRQVLSSHQTGLEQPQHSAVSFAGQPWATRRPSFQGPYIGSTFLEQRRAEKERRALLAVAAQPLEFPSQPSWCVERQQWPKESSSPYTTVRARAPYAAPDGRSANGGGSNSARGGASGTSRARARRESVERWLEEQTAPAPEPTGGRGPDASSQAGSSLVRDPSLTYRQYAITQAYGGRSAGLRPTSSLPVVLSSGGRRPGYGFGGPVQGYEQRRRLSSGAGDLAPRRSSASPPQAHMRQLVGW